MTPLHLYSLLHYFYTLADKIAENKPVMLQLKNSPEQALNGDDPDAFYGAVMDSSDAHENQKFQLLSDTGLGQDMMKLLLAHLAQRPMK